MIKKLQKEIKETSDKLVALQKQLKEEEKLELEKQKAKSKSESDAAQQVGAEFTALVESWTEYEHEPGWGGSQRSDGFRFYKNSAERLTYIAASHKKQRDYDREHPDHSGYSCFWKEDDNVKLVKVPKELWDEIQTKNAVSYHHVEIKDYVIIKYGN